MRALRIAMVGQRGVPATFGGIERHVEELGAALVGRGHEVTVFCRDNYTDGALTEHRGMRLRRSGTVGTKHLDAIVHSGTSTIAAMRERYDVLHFHAIGPGLVAPIPRLLGRSRIVQTIHGLDGERAKWSQAARAVLTCGTFLSARVPHATIVVAEGLRRHYHERFGCEAFHIPNGVPPAQHRAAGPFLAAHGLEPGGYLLFVGRFVPEKAPDRLVRAFARVDGRVKLVLAGGSSFTDGYVDELRRAAAADPRVVLPGYVYGDDLAELYSNAAAFVLPSDLEGLPITLLEAASYGVPIVASAIDPHVEVLISDGPGRRLVQPDDVDALAAALTGVLRGLDVERTGAAALRAETTAVFRWDAVAEATEDVYRYVLGGPDPRRASRPASVPEVVGTITGAPVLAPTNGATTGGRVIALPDLESIGREVGAP